MNNDVINVKIENLQGDKLHVVHSEYKIFQYQGFQHEVDDVESIIGLIRRYGSPEKTIVFVNKDRVHVIFDDTVRDRPQNTASCTFLCSEEFMDWRTLACDPISQKEFVDFLKCRPEGEIENIDTLIASVKILKIATQTVGDYQYDERGNITFMYKAKEKEGVCTFPSVIKIKIPVLKGSSNVTDVEMELEIIKPKSEEEKPLFKLSCPKWKRYYNEAVEAEIEKLKNELPHYLIVNG